MNHRFFLLALTFLLAPVASGQESNSCVGCHTELGDEYVVPVKEWQEGVHARAGVSCEACHGGDPASWDVEVSMSPAKGFIGRPTGKQIVKICGDCHSDAAKMRQYGIRTDQLALYKTSHHGEAVLEKGSADAATCVSCHDNHGVLPPSNPKSPVHHKNVPEMCASCHADEAKMAKAGLPSNALEEYKASYHGTLLYRDGNPLVPNCATCHGFHGATPPGVDEVAHVCGQCHGNTAENYAKGPHEKARQFHGFPRCVDCHGNHKILFPSRDLFVDTDTGCFSCHDGDTGAGVAKALHSEFTRVETLVEGAETRAGKASGRFVYLDPYLERLREARSRLVEAGPVSHSLDVEAVKSFTSEAAAIAHEVEQGIAKKEEEVDVRRLAWYIVAAVTILWVALVVLKLRQIPNPYGGDDGHGPGGA